MAYKKRIIKISICCLLLATVFMTGCLPKKAQQDPAKTEDKEDKKETKDKKDAKKEENKEEKKEEDVIVAGSVDTQSKFTFSVEQAIIGLQTYSEEPIVVLAGTFTNNSDEEISFSWALDATATQGGFTLSTASISGTGDYNYNKIAPGMTIPVFIGWKIADDQNDITLKVVDKQHYAKQEIYSQTFTINELIENTKNFQDSGEVIDSPLEA